MPGTDTIIAERNGYKTQIYRNTIVAGDDGGGVFFDLDSGEETSERDPTHKLMRK